MALTTEQIRNNMIADLNQLIPQVETNKGPIRDLWINPVAGESNLLRTEVDSVRRLYSVDFADAMSRAELESLAFQYGIQPFNGSSATGVVTLKVTTVPGRVLVVPEGSIFSTDDGQFNFLSTGLVEIPKENIQQFYVPSSKAYEIPVVVNAELVGEASNVAAFRITKVASPLNFNATVLNYAEISGGRDAESNDELSDRIRDVSVQNERGTTAGLRRSILENNTKTMDVSIIRNIDSIGTFDTYRAQLDSFTIGEESELSTEAFTAPLSENNQTFALANPPIIDVVSVLVNDVELPTTSWRLNRNPQRSSRDFDSVTIRSFVAVNSTITITYTYNKLLHDLDQAFISSSDDLFGVNMRFREGVDVPLRVGVTVSIQNSSNSSVFVSSIVSKIAEYCNPNKFVDELTSMGLREFLRDEIVGLLSVTVTDFARLSDTDTTDIITFEDFEYPTISATDITIKS